uniref:Uncharacterized protein n=1 Tax=Myotis myotis TaxID=51298 RepID=A0A7J7RMM6_MYOMY|nr:hypothetical protein mMyoMyo1_010248 [Myotis myotis]
MAWSRAGAKGLQGSRERRLAGGSASGARAELPWNPGLGGSAASPKPWVCHVEPGSLRAGAGVKLRVPLAASSQARAQTAERGAGGRWGIRPAAERARWPGAPRGAGLRPGSRAKDPWSPSLAAWKAPHVQAPRSRPRRFPAMN